MIGMKKCGDLAACKRSRIHVNALIDQTGNY